MSPAEQIHELKSLSQQAAAYMLDANGRSLRDWPDIPRHGDGTYDAQDLVAWARRRLPRPDLADEDLEEVLTVCELLYSGAHEAWGLLADWLRNFHARYGDAGFALVLQTMLDEFRQQAANGDGRARAGRPPTWPEWIEQQRPAYNAEVQAWERTVLDVATVCSGCSRLRRGRRWVQTVPPAGFRVTPGECPACAARQTQSPRRTRG